jgi:hypothetical protein
LICVATAMLPVRQIMENKDDDEVSQF